MSLMNKMNGWRVLWLVSNSIFVSWLFWLITHLSGRETAIAERDMNIIGLLFFVTPATYLIGSVIALSRLNKANGWQRLWLVSICIFFLWALFGTFTGSHYKVAGMPALLLVPFISLGTYALGIAISWVVKGFKG